MNQLYRLFEKEIGVVYKVQLRRIPTPKDGDPQDAIAIWEEEARARGIIFEDDSPENLKAPISNTQTSAVMDLNRSTEMQTRYQLAVALKNECWELIGMNRQRLGESLATETATANQNNLAQSFAQTEPYFAAHEYVMSQVYQALVDAAQYKESQKPMSTLSYITAQGDSAFIQVTPKDIKLKDLWVMNTNNAEDQQLFREIRALSQPAMQNGASFYDIITLYSTNSIRQMRKVFKSLKDKQDNLLMSQQQTQQQQVEGQQQLGQAQLEQAERHHQEDNELKKYIADTTNATKLEGEEIKTYFQNPGGDVNENGMPDIMEIAAHSLEIQRDLTAADMEGKKMALDTKKHEDDMRIKKAGLEIQKDKIKNEKERNQIMKKKAVTKPKAK
jgi:hypothetical protein